MRKYEMLLSIYIFFWRIMRYKYTDEDIEFLKENYPIGNWDKIFERFPFLSKGAIHKKCYKSGIKFNMEYKRRTFDSINKVKWTKEEIKIMKDNYSFVPISEMQLLLPNRTINSIRLQGNKLGLISYTKINELWTESELNYIKDNWYLVPDKIMADNLTRTPRAVKAKREELGLYRVDIESSSYPSLSKFLRGQNQKWKKDSMKNCNYKCVLTGSKNYEIHHLYGVSNIIHDILEEYPNFKDKEFSNYTENDLSFILQKFIEKQSLYPLGECVDKKLHVLFHSMYGQYKNTPDQWYKFKEDYFNGIYKKYA